MIYLIQGDEPFLIKERLNKIIKENKDAEIVKIDGNDQDFSYEKLVDSISSVGLFASKSVILAKDIPFLINKIDEKNYQSILDYCLNPVYENDLVFYSLENKYNGRLKSFKDVSSNAQVININKLPRPDFISFAKGKISEYHLNIDSDTAYLLINSVNMDITLLINNIEVLSLYPGKIDNDVLRKLITLPSDEDVFTFINALTNKNVSAAILSAQRLLENDESILRLISTIASQLRFLYQVAYYNKQGLSTNEIIKITGAKEFRIKKANETLANLSLDEILRLLNKLADLDYKCKVNNDLPDKLNLELLIVSILN